jgi:hypothetical protein
MDTTNKPKTIATIDVNVHMPKVGKKEWLQESLEDHFHCVLCGSELEFQHKTDFILQTVTEDAHCPACHVRNRQTAHILQ